MILLKLDASIYYILFIQILYYPPTIGIYETMKIKTVLDLKLMETYKKYIIRIVTYIKIRYPKIN